MSGVTLSETVYMFYLNWQTFIQTSIMCNVNILSINYIAPLSNISSPPTRETFYSANFHSSQQTTGINPEDFRQFHFRAGEYLLRSDLEEYRKCMFIEMKYKWGFLKRSIKEIFVFTLFCLSFIVY